MAKFAHTALGDGAAAVTTGGVRVVKNTGLLVTVTQYFIAMNGYMMYQTADTDIEFTSSTSEQVFYIGARLDVATITLKTTMCMLTLHLYQIQTLRRVNDDHGKRSHDHGRI
jgi:hypothetical protein